MEPMEYQICVRGRSTERMAVALDGMTLRDDAADTVFTGEVKDQSQLFGLLNRMRALGLELVSLQPWDGPSPPSGDHQNTR
jgi:hypothetical protein